MSETQTKGARFKNNYFDGLKVTNVHKIVFFIVMMAYFFEQMDNWNFGFISPAIRNGWGLELAQLSQITFAYFMAMTLGGLTGGIISDFIGRRKTFLIAIFVFSTASVANGFVPNGNLELFILTRACTGFGVFCLMVCSQAYIAEMAPADSRGKWQGLTAAIGFCAAPIIGFLCTIVIPMNPEAWRYIFFAGGFGFVAFLFGLKYLKESPRWLVSKGRLAEAEKVVFDITGKDIDLSDAAKLVPTRQKVSTVLVGMFSRKYIKRTLLLCFFMLLVTPAAFVVTNWTTQLLASRGLDAAEAMKITFVMMIGVPVGLLVSSVVSDKGGRKYPLAILYALSAVLALGFGFAEGFWPIAIVGFVLVACIMAAGFIGFSYIAESYPTVTRNTAAGVHNGVGRLATSGFQLVIPVLFAQFAFVGVYSTVAIMLIIPVVLLLIFGMKTGGKSLEEIS
jgi:putative MFS transporter